MELAKIRAYKLKNKIFLTKGFFILLRCTFCPYVQHLFKYSGEALELTIMKTKLGKKM